MRDALSLLKEQEANKPHRRNGYWIEDAKTYPGAGLSNYVCSNCGKTGGTWVKHIAPDRTFPWCPYCGINMSGKKVRYAD
jgi:DNA-directed RNA polymerase subunit RPC12/RpoP